jgi:hypothetical protein
MLVTRGKPDGQDQRLYNAYDCKAIHEETSVCIDLKDYGVPSTTSVNICAHYLE